MRDDQEFAFTKSPPNIKEAREIHDNFNDIRLSPHGVKNV